MIRNIYRRKKRLNSLKPLSSGKYVNHGMALPPKFISRLVFTTVTDSHYTLDQLNYTLRNLRDTNVILLLN